LRSELEVQRFRESAVEQWGDSDPCVDYYANCYEAGVPRTFWNVASGDVKYNREVFERVILRYCAKRRKAQKHGWSLILIGDNGVGKTMFVSFVLTQMIKRGASAYYTTLAQLDVDIKRGFSDSEATTRLESLLSSDFLAIDELGKEHFRSDSYLNIRLELLLKQRYDDGDPTILSTNVAVETLVDMYGPSIASMIEGKYHIVTMESGDFRKSVATKMRKDMGF
jgi:DNA replication protein DnaC